MSSMWFSILVNLRLIFSIFAFIASSLEDSNSVVFVPVVVVSEVPACFPGSPSGCVNGVDKEESNESSGLINSLVALLGSVFKLNGSFNPKSEDSSVASRSEVSKLVSSF